MKKLISKLALFMLVAVGAFVSFTHAQWVKETTLLPGTDFNATLWDLIGNFNSIITIERSSVEVPSWITTRMISVDGSTYPVYVWDAWQWHVYYYTEADKIYMNPDSAGMFSEMTNLTKLDIGDWDTSKVTNMSNMFANCNNLEDLDIRNFDTSHVTNMGSMFIYCTSLTELDLSSFDTSNVTNISAMFAYDTNLRKIYVSTNFVTNDIINHNGMFASDTSLVWWRGTTYDSNHMDVEYARIDSYGLPWYFTAKMDITMLISGSEFNSKLEGLAAQLNNITNIEKAESIPSWVAKEKISLWGSEYPVYAWYNNGTIYYYTDADKVYMNPNSAKMFSEMESLEEFDEDWNTSYVTGMFEMFDGTSLKKLDLSNWDVSKVENMSEMFENCKLEELDISNWDTSSLHNTDYMFDGCTDLEIIYASTWFDTSTIEYSSNMFGNNLKLEWWNWTKYDSGHTDVTYARIDKEWQPWYFTEKLDYTMLLPGSGFNVEIKKLAGNAGADYNSQDLNITAITQWTWDDVPSWVTTGIISMRGSEYPVYAWYKNWTIYYYAKTDKIYMNPNSSYMFNNLRRVSSINGGFDTSKVTNMRGMFQNDTSLKSLDLSGWNTSQVTNMQEVFQWCTSLQTLDLSSWNTNNVTTMGRIFDNCTGLNTIYVSDNFVTNNVEDDYQMFTTDTKLVWWNGTKYDSNYVDKTYAKIDKAWQTGYFTDKNSFIVKFINTVNWTETLLTTSKWHQINIPNMNWYTVKWVYSDEAMTQPIDLSNWLDGYTEIYVKYERNWWWNWGGSSGWWWRWGSSSSSDSSNKNNDTTDSDTKWNDKSNTVSSWTNVETDVSKNGKSESTASQAKNNSKKTQISYNDATEELMAAYRFAFRNWITTKSTTENARLYGSLTRIQMAKMLSQFAINVLWQEPDLSKWVANFSDVSRELDKKYDNWVTLAYQLGIMWKNLKNNKFRPYDEVTRAEFATALSRMLYHIEDWTWKVKYYAPHIAKLYEEWILNRVDPKRIEKRWYVMIMLMRSAN